MLAKLLAALSAVLVSADDRITNLPGWNGPQAMYAGYINVNVSHGRNLFYWLVESASADPSKDPLGSFFAAQKQTSNPFPNLKPLPNLLPPPPPLQKVLWTNGGPGCSGLSGGLFSEFGPFFPNIDGSLSLTPNAWTWTQKANVIFIEQPAGVGFSWSADTDDYTVGDAQAAEDVYSFLLGFTARYPQYAGRPLYLSGESYGGVRLRPPSVPKKRATKKHPNTQP